jgi:hypothetical protein
MGWSIRVRDTNGRLHLSTPDRALAITIVVITAPKAA